jgi:serine phosphatase RsbU (regulator of sigma subunit)/PAS domain-containing protein
VAALRTRGDELRLAAALPGARLRPILEAALAEVDAAADALSRQRPPGGRAPSGAAHAERRLLHAVFSQLPVPVFLLGQDQVIRRANEAAARLLGTAPGYVTGKQLAALVDMPDRARVQTQLAATLRTGSVGRVSCGLLGATGVVPGELSLSMAGLRGDSDQLIVAITADETVAAGKGRRGGQGGQGGRNRTAGQREAAAPAAGQDDIALVRELTGRLDLAADIARLLLEDLSAGESSSVQRCARQLAGRLAPWVIVDVERRGRLRRQIVAGPQDPESEELTRTVAALVAEPGSAPQAAWESLGPVLITHAEDAEVLGMTPEGIPVAMALGAASVLSVPLSDGERGYGALTLIRRASDGHFGMADSAAAEAVGEQLALAIRACRAFRQHSAVAAALRATLLPGELPQVPGVELAVAHVAAASGPEVGGEFYDIHPGGTVLAIGDVCGTGRDAVTIACAARYALRAAGASAPGPEAMLRAANDVLIAEDLAGEFVTAHVARLEWRSARLRVELASAGQPAPVLATADGQVRQLRGGGQPLGIFPDAAPSAQRLELSPGDVLFFLTDGVADARSLELGYFADQLTDELAALAGRPAAEIAAGMRRRALEFCDGEVRDDMTMLVLRVTEPPDD